MKNYILSIFLAFFTLSVYCQNDKSERFNNDLEKLGMTFTPPEGYNEVPTHNNQQMDYEKAYKHPTKKFEVRYTTRAHKITDFAGVFKVTVVKIAHKHPAEFTFFTKERVKEKYNGDVGGTIMVDVHQDFAPDYKYCMMVIINKKGVGDLISFYLTDDLTVMSKLSAPIMYGLKFKD